MSRNDWDALRRKVRVRRKILVVDDSELVLQSVAMLLEERGYDVVPVAGVFALAQSVALEAPDLILMDVDMPAVPGDKAVEIARRNGSTRCPIVLFSDRKAEVLQMLALECGAAGFIQKTGDGDALAAAVEKYLARGSARGGPK